MSLLLTTSSFSIPDVSHVPPLNMNLFSDAQISDSNCCVILDVDSFCLGSSRQGYGWG
jgi:hypothetical protein